MNWVEETHLLPRAFSLYRTAPLPGATPQVSRASSPLRATTTPTDLPLAAGVVLTGVLRTLPFLVPSDLKIIFFSYWKNTGAGEACGV